MIGSNPPGFWWGPVTIYLFIGGLFHLVWPSGFEAITGLILLGFFLRSYYSSPGQAIRDIGWILFPIRNTVTITVDKDGKRIDHIPGKSETPQSHKTIIVVEPELTPEEMERFSTKKKNWEKAKTLDEYNEEPF